MLNKMKEMYSKMNYDMNIVNIEGVEVGFLYFGKRKSSPDMIVLNKDDCSNDCDIKDVVNTLYKIGDKADCNKFHLITLIKPEDNILKELSLLNIKISDYNDIANNYKSILKGRYIELLPHNEYTLNEADNLLGKHKKVAIIQATGTGKSFIIGRFLSNDKYGKKVVITPSKHIINQIQKYFGNSLDESISFMTYSKLIHMKDEELANLSIDTLILDEFHRAGASKWEESVRKLLSLNKDVYLIGATATPRRYLDNDRNMVEELFDGISTEEIDVSSAIARGILPNPKYIYSVFNFGNEIDKAIKLVEEGYYKEDESDLKENWISALDRFKLDWSNSKGLDDVVRNYLKKDGTNKFIVFCSNRQHIEEMQLEFKKCLSKNGFILENQEVIYSGLYNNEKTLSTFENYKIKKDNGVSLLFCIDMLSEGVHLKSSETGTDLLGVFLMRSTESPIIFYQQIGRALSSTMKKTPIIFDLTNNCASIKTKFYQQDLEEKEDSINKIKEKFGAKPSKYVSAIDVRCTDVLTLLSTIKDKFDSPWKSKIADVQKFVEENGHGAISLQNAEKSLGLWAQSIRSRYYRGHLSTECVDALNSLGFVWNLLDYKVETKIKELEQFKDENGFITTVTKKDNEEYYNFISFLRTSYRKGNLSKERIELLESMGFVWDIDEYRWNLMYNELLEYNKQKKDAELNFKISKPQSAKLRNWIVVQKNKYDKGTLSEEKINMLKEANISFLRDMDSWTKSYNKFLLAMEKPKDKRPAYATNWITKQRNLYANGKLTKEQIELIEKQGISLQKNDDIFWGHFNTLVEYKTLHGTCRVLEKNTPSKTFYAWYNNLKTVFDKLSKDKQEALLSLGYVRYTRDAIWNDNIEIYRRIKDKPYSTLTKEELKVYNWARGVRRRYKVGTLNKSKIEEAKELILT